MEINDEIRTYLVTRRNELYEVVCSDDTATMLRERFEMIDPDQVKEQFYQELISNCKDWWLQTTTPINAILFTHDYIYGPDEEIDANGILFNKIEEWNIQAQSYRVNRRYDVVESFDGMPGVILRILNDVDQSKLSVTADELTESYILTALISLHDALTNLVETGVLNNLDWHSPLHIIIDMHEYFLPLLYVSK